MDVSGRVPVALVERKTSDQDKVDRLYDRNPLVTDEALAIVLHKLDTLSPDELFFPQWSSEVASKVIKRLAASEGWEGGVQWCTYSARHGAARDAFENGLAEAMNRGNWTTTRSAIRYGATPSQETRRSSSHQAVLREHAEAQRTRARQRARQRAS